MLFLIFAFLVLAAANPAAAIWAFLVAHQLIVFYVLAVLIEQLPPPDEKSSALYKYVYSVAQIFAGNWRRTKDAVALPAAPKA